LSFAVAANTCMFMCEINIYMMPLPTISSRRSGIASHCSLLST